MDIIEINKVLSNKTRVNILKWLKNPELNFPPHKDIAHFDDGVCVGYIQDKTGLSQSTISTFFECHAACQSGHPDPTWQMDLLQKK